MKAYGDTTGDGRIQVSFTLPIPADARARGIAAAYARETGLEEVLVAHAEPTGPDHTWFVVYATSPADIDPDAIEIETVEAPALGFDEVNAMVMEQAGRRLVVLGACIESDAHTVGIDAIMSPKGYAGHYGIERYPCFRAHNLGAQVESERLLEIARAESADVLLISQVVTQQDAMVHNLSRLRETLERGGVRERLILICGGPRIEHAQARELGYDAGFGPGTTPSEVAAYIAHEARRRLSAGRPLGLAQAETAS